MPISHFKSAAGFSEAIALVFERIIQYSICGIMYVDYQVMMIDGINLFNPNGHSSDHKEGFSFIKLKKCY